MKLKHTKLPWLLEKLAPAHTFIFKTVQVFFVSNFCEDEYNLQVCLYITADKQCLTYLSLKAFQQNAWWLHTLSKIIFDRPHAV